MSKPVWFLDIDGVINALGAPTPAGYRHTLAETMGQEWPIRWRREVVDFVNSASRDGHAEVRWLTTWADDARTSLAPAIGLDDFIAYDMPDTDSPRGWWKSDVIADFVAKESRPFIWTDDDLQSEDVSFLTNVAVNHLALCPDMAVGLNDDNLTRIHDMMLCMATTEGSPNR